MQTEELPKGEVPLGWAVLILAVLFGLACVPIWVVKYPPLVDYPMHVARAYLLSLPQNGQGITEFYQGKWTPIPNLGMDIVVSTMMRFMPPLVAGKVFLCLIHLVILTGGFAFSVALRKRVSWVSFLPALGLYDMWFMMGFANYLFGIGLAFWAVALYLWSESWPPKKRWGVLAVFGVVLAVCHLMALAVALGCCFALWMKDKGPWKPWASMLVGSLSVCAVAYVGLRLTGRIPVTAWDRYVILRDGFGFGAMFLVLGSVAVSQVLEPRTRPLLIGLAVFSLFGPSMLAGTAFACDRLTLPLILAVLASFTFRHQKGDGLRVATLGVGTVLGLTDKLMAWSPESLFTSQVVSELEKVPDGSTLASFDIGLRHQPTWRYQRHIADWILIEKPVFVAQNFAKKRQQPMVFQPEFESWHVYQQNNPVELDRWDQVAGQVPNLRRLQSDAYRLGTGRAASARELHVLVYHRKDQAYDLKSDPDFVVEAEGDEFTLLKVR